MQKMKRQLAFIGTIMVSIALLNCTGSEQKEKEEPKTETPAEKKKEPISQPLVTHIYTADPSAHVFNGKIYIYPSHDIEAGVPFDDLGSHFAMEDYHVLSLDSPDGEATDHGVALHVNDVPWAKQQMWAPDATEKGGTWYLFFPAKDYD